MVLCFWTSYYRPQRSWGKVIFSEACVKNSVHTEGVHGKGGMNGRGALHGRGCVWLGGMHRRGCMWQEGHAWQGAHVWQEGTHAAPQQILQDMVNERAVGILLECILVFTLFGKKSAKESTYVKV